MLVYSARDSYSCATALIQSANEIRLQENLQNIYASPSTQNRRRRSACVDLAVVINYRRHRSLKLVPVGTRIKEIQVAAVRRDTPSLEVHQIFSDPKFDGGSISVDPGRVSGSSGRKWASKSVRVKGGRYAPP